MEVLWEDDEPGPDGGVYTGAGDAMTLDCSGGEEEGKPDVGTEVITEVPVLGVDVETGGRVWIEDVEVIEDVLERFELDIIDDILCEVICLEVVRCGTVEMEMSGGARQQLRS